MKSMSNLESVDTPNRMRNTTLTRVLWGSAGTEQALKRLTADGFLHLPPLNLRKTN